LELLTFGELEVVGRLVDASNLALQANLSVDGLDLLVMYKPVSGERELWDFPEGTLAGREAASFVVSAVGGWGLVPPTVVRDGPFGPGTVQLWVEQVGEQPSAGLIDVLPVKAVPAGWLPVLNAQLYDGSHVVVAHADRPDLAAAAVFDVVVNNADRKGSHLVLDASATLRGFDHGLTFHESDKLRTVLWGWAGDALPGAERDRLATLAGWLCTPGSAVARTLSTLLTAAEVGALNRRIARLLRAGSFPQPGGRSPAVPWPPL